MEGEGTRNASSFKSVVPKVNYWIGHLAKKSMEGKARGGGRQRRV